MKIHESVVGGRQTIVDDNLLPLAETPEAEVEGAAVSVAETLFLRHDLVEEGAVGCQARDRCDQPAVI